MRISPFFLISIIFIAFTILSGCQTNPSAEYDRQFVRTFAELSLMYEKEKITNNAADSLYQQKVVEFFKAHGMEQEQFKRKVDKLSADNEIWKNFIQDVSKVMDSVKALQNKPGKI